MNERKSLKRSNHGLNFSTRHPLARATVETTSCESVGRHLVSEMIVMTSNPGRHGPLLKMGDKKLEKEKPLMGETTDRKDG